MEILIFISGFVLGAIGVSIPLYLNKKTMLEQLNLQFENTANKVLKDNSTTLTEQNSEKLEEFFKRFRDKIEDFEKRAEENLKTENENFTKFDLNIKNFIEAGNKISQDTLNLTNVMKADNKTSGRWGEIVLEKVLELSGLRKDEEYSIQKGVNSGIADAKINLPNNRTIYIDSKNSFNSWYNYTNAENEDEKVLHLKEFYKSIKAHITGLSNRDYADDITSPDYILMFIPIEGCYSMLFCNDCELWDFACQKNILPVSPSTLLAALKIINTFHQTNRQNKNILEMAKLCAEIHDKFADLLNDLNNINKHLNNSLTKLEGKGNIISKIEKLESLGAKVEKQLPELKL